MSTEDELAQFSPSRPSLASIGVFDGVHLGHQRLLNRLHQESLSQGLRSVAIVFQNNPIEVVRPEDPIIPYLSSLSERLSLIEKLVDLVIPLKFDLQLSRLSAREFLSMLQEFLGVRGLVVGPSFSIGHGREIQTLPALRDLGNMMDLSVKFVEGLNIKGVPASSTVIKESLSSGDVENAARLLGRLFSLTGFVSRGEGRGRNLGFPTANLELPPDLVLPSNGVYATWAETPEGRHACATSIGTRPTFGYGPRTIEGHLINYSGNLYGQSIRLEFAHWLRPEERFERPESLVAQMNQDVKRVSGLLRFGPINSFGDNHPERDRLV
jgi:riboflavin kinase/FMN adenylyltransferase